MLDRIRLNLMIAVAVLISLTPRGKDRMARTGCDIVGLVDGLPELYERLFPLSR